MSQSWCPQQGTFQYKYIYNIHGSETNVRTAAPSDSDSRHLADCRGTTRLERLVEPGHNRSWQTTEAERILDSTERQWQRTVTLALHQCNDRKGCFHAIRMRMMFTYRNALLTKRQQQTTWITKTSACGAVARTV